MRIIECIMNLATCFLIFTATLSCLSGCASFEQVSACNKLAYQEAPPVYDNNQVRMLMMHCQLGLGPFSAPFPKSGTIPQPLFCNQLEPEDLNYWARRSIFNACMKGVTPTSVLIEPTGALPGPAVVAP